MRSLVGLIDVGEATGQGELRGKGEVNGCGKEVIRVRIRLHPGLCCLSTLLVYIGPEESNW